jgi:hypothetical protein
MPTTDTAAPTADTREPNKKNGSAATSKPTADSSASVKRIAWNDAVPEGKKLVANIGAAERDIERYQWRLGELAHKVVHPTYGDRTLANFAKEIGIHKTTLNHYRTVYRKWEGKLPPGAKLPSFTVLKELQAVEARAELIEAEPDMSKRRAEALRVLKDHPKLEEIRRNYPDLTCTRQARKIMDSYDAGGAGNGKGSSKYDKRWFKKLIDRCEEDMDEAALVDQRLTVKQLSSLLGASEPALLGTMKECGEGWLALYHLLSRLCEKGPQVVFEERELEHHAKENAAKAELPKHKRQKAATAQAIAPAQVGV